MITFANEFEFVVMISSCVFELPLHGNTMYYMRREEALFSLKSIRSAAGLSFFQKPHPVHPLIRMDVTRSNFLTLLPVIEEAVANCDFVSIDEELSGLRKGRGGDMFDLQVGILISCFPSDCFLSAGRAVQEDAQCVYGLFDHTIWTDLLPEKPRTRKWAAVIHLSLVQYFHLSLQSARTAPTFGT